MFRARYKHIKSIIACGLVLGLGLSAAANAAVYIPSARDTQPPPARYTYEITDTTGYTLMTTQGRLNYYFREDRDVFLIEDTVTGETWKTGIDAPFKKEAEASGEPYEDNLNTGYVAFANSLISVEYYTASLSVEMIASAAETSATSTLMTAADGHYVLEVYFSALDLGVNVHIYCTEEGIRTVVPDDEISGEGQSRLASIIVMPFLGAAGGAKYYYNEETGKHDIREANPMTPGYVFVPDGSGALIRFRDNSVSLRRYTGSVYGINPAESMYYYTDYSSAVAFKYPLMPVFGIAHGDEQKAFVAWADGGSEYLEIIMSPEENMTYYNFCYPRFVYNAQFHQVYNREGSGYFKLADERNRFDLDISYAFLFEEAADYVGMAQKYRDHLLETGELALAALPSETPIRLDFIMSDVKKGVIGHSDVIATTPGDVEDILTELVGAGVNGINSGLMGAQKGGITKAKPWTLNLNSSAYDDLISSMNNLGVDVSFAQDYSRINSLQMLLTSNQAYHRNRWGVTEAVDYRAYIPVTEISYARPAKSVEWLNSQTNLMKKQGVTSTTIEGITQNLISHYGDNPTRMADTIAMYREAFEGLGLKINALTPNAYLWKYTDRFLQMPVMTTQYIIETDTVPFLQLVLHGTTEMYAPYANFSFNSDEDILRMIDYNVSPSFVLTSEPAHLLSSTNSSDYYSTEYSLYKDIIIEVYGKVSEVLDKVAGKAWTDRTVLQNGVIMNTYADGTRVIINYTTLQVPYAGHDIPPLSAKVI